MIIFKKCNCQLLNADKNKQLMMLILKAGMKKLLLLQSMKHLLLLLLLVASIATERTFNLTDWNKTLNVPPEQMSNETKILTMFF